MPSDVNVTTYDGRAYLKAIDKRYDVIIVDAYQDISVPFQMSSTEFFTEVKNHLNNNGVMVINMNMRGETKDSINAYLSDTISTVFKNVYTVDASGWTNSELFASNSEDMISNLEKNISALNNSESSFYSLSNTDAENNSKNTFELSSAKNAELASMMDTVSENLVKYNAGSYILTDDKAPVEVLSMRVLDKMIQEEVGYYKDIYHKKGLKGLLDEL